MKKCLSCEKEINTNDLVHIKCLKQLFKVSYLPAINIELANIGILAQESSGKLSISGIQPKLSLRINKKQKQFELATEKGEYILKPQNNSFPHLPENENLCMNIAAFLGLKVPSHSLLRLKDQTLAYIVKRFDRHNGYKIHQENFFQIFNKRDSYKGSIEEIGRKLIDVALFPGLEIQLLYARVIVDFLLGNGDAHLKNFSIIYDEQNKIKLSPFYDIVSSKLVLPGSEDSALAINGKKNNLTRNDFLKLAEYLNIPPKIANYFYEDKKEIILNLVKQSFLPKNYRDKLIQIINERFQRITKQFRKAQLTFKIK